MSDQQQNLVLYASFIQNRQQERTNKSFRLIKDLITNKGDPEALTKNLELSQTELKEKQLTSLKQAWEETTYPALTISDFVRYHTMYQTELLDLENIRLLANNNYLLQKKQEAGPQRAHEVTPESLGLTNSRRPIPKLPPTHITKETGANYGIAKRPTSSLSNSHHQPQRSQRHPHLPSLNHLGGSTTLCEEYYHQRKTSWFW